MSENTQNVAAVAPSIQIMDPGAVYAEAMQLFPNQPHLRMIHYGRHATYRNAALGRNPRMAVFDFIGAHGEGKTAIMAEYVKRVTGVSEATHSVEEVNEVLARHLTIVRGGGITDFADITGLQYIDPATKKTRLARQEAFGAVGESDWRLVVIDDWTRALPHILQGLMHIMNEGRFNSFAMDKGTFIVATRNPEGEDYNVSGIDPAQYSRTIPVAYNASEKTFFEQLQAQKMDPDIINFWMKHPELAKPRQVKIKPVKEANCSRFRTLFSSIYEYIKHDQLVLTEVVTTMFGPEMLSQMLADRRAQQPIAPQEILQNWDANMEKKIQEYAKGHQDVLTVTAQRLAYFLNDKDTQVTQAELTNAVNFMASTPKDIGFATMKLLVDVGQPKADHYAMQIGAISRTLPPEKNVAKMLIDLRNSIDKKLKSM